MAGRDWEERGKTLAGGGLSRRMGASYGLYIERIDRGDKNFC